MRRPPLMHRLLSMGRAPVDAPAPVDGPAATSRAAGEGTPAATGTASGDSAAALAEEVARALDRVLGPHRVSR